LLQTSEGLLHIQPSASCSRKQIVCLLLLVMQLLLLLLLLLELLVLEKVGLGRRGSLRRGKPIVREAGGCVHWHEPWITHYQKKWTPFRRRHRILERTLRWLSVTVPLRASRQVRAFVCFNAATSLHFSFFLNREPDWRWNRSARGFVLAKDLGAIAGPLDDGTIQLHCVGNRIPRNNFCS